MNQQPFVIGYRGMSIEFSPLTSGGRIVGYLYDCPTCKAKGRASNWIDTESGTKHSLTFSEDGKPTIRASMLCPQGCGWHVFVTDGVAVDA